MPAKYLCSFQFDNALARLSESTMKISQTKESSNSTLPRAIYQTRDTLVVIDPGPWLGDDNIFVEAKAHYAHQKFRFGL
jgi:hypothetical protein